MTPFGCAHVLIQPMAADDVAAAVCEISQRPPADGVVEIAGPEQFRLDELIRQRPEGERRPAHRRRRPRGALLRRRAATSAPCCRTNAVHLGEIRFDDWLAQPAAGVGRVPAVTSSSPPRHLRARGEAGSQRTTTRRALLRPRLRLRDHPALAPDPRRPHRSAAWQARSSCWSSSGGRGSTRPGWSNWFDPASPVVRHGPHRRDARQPAHGRGPARGAGRARHAVRGELRRAAGGA